MVFGRFDDAPSPYTWFLGSLGFVATVMSGVFASTLIRGNYTLGWLKSDNTQVHKTSLLILVGVSLLVVSLILNHWFVVIKPIWNPTFVLLTSGISFLLIALFYFIIDVKGYQRWAFWLRVFWSHNRTLLNMWNKWYSGVSMMHLHLIHGFWARSVLLPR